MAESRSRPPEGRRGHRKPCAAGPRWRWPRQTYRWNETDAEIVDAIRTLTAKNSIPPTLSEIAKEISVAVQTIHRRLATLREVGAVTYRDRASRTVQVLDDGVKRVRGALTLHASVLGEELGVPAPVLASVSEWIG